MGGHYHLKKDELWRIIYGRLFVEYSTEDCLDENGDYQQNRMSWCILHPGEVFHIPAGLRHRMVGSTDCLLLEVSTTHSEEDVVRLIKSEIFNEQ